MNERSSSRSWNFQETRLFGLLGDPVQQSRSPQMHNAAYQACGLDALYLPLRTLDLEQALLGMKALEPFQGASVTHPFKQAILPRLDKVDPVAEAIGSVNTVHKRGLALHGYNTDWLGARATLSEALSGQTKPQVAVLGAGGCARAVVYAALDLGYPVTVVNRTRTNGELLAQRFGTDFCPLDEITQLKADCLFHTTPVGMPPLLEQSLVPLEALANFPIVIDAVYTPLETRLLREAKQRGCQAVSGVGMVIAQAAEQIRIWTGLDAPLDIMREAIDLK